MSKISLTNLVNLTNQTTAVNAINANNAVLTTALDNTLSRDGTSPNAMNASLDMNSNRILNLPAPVASSEPLRLTDLTSFSQFQNSVNLAAAVASATASASTATTQAGIATTEAGIATTAAATIGTTFGNLSTISSGSGVGLLKHTAANTWEINNATDFQRVVPHTNFSYFPGRISGCSAPGLAKHDIELSQQFDLDYGGDGGFLGAFNDAGVPNWVGSGNDVLVSLTGNDATGNGRPNAPYRTVKKALQVIGTSGLGSIWIDSGTYTEQLVLNATDATISAGAAARAVKIKALNGRGSVVFANHLDSTPTSLTWTLVAGPGYTATPAGNNRVMQVIWVQTNVETGKKTYTALPIMTTAANVTSFGMGWFQDNGTRLITIAVLGMDFTTTNVKNQFLFMYDTSLLQYNSFNGTKLYMENIDFVGSATLGVFWQLGHPAKRPVLYVKNCGFHFCEGSGIHPEGATIYTQNLDIQGCGNGDGINYYPDQVAGTSAACQALEVDLNIWDSGQVSKFGPSARNCQASSAHSGMKVIQINGFYRRSYGQNVAHVGTTTYYWCVGGEFGTPLAVISGSPASVSAYDNIYLEGVAWLDTCKAYGIGSLVGLDAVAGSVVKTFNCNFKGTSSDTLGSVGTYNPASP